MLHALEFNETEWLEIERVGVEEVAGTPTAWILGQPLTWQQWSAVAGALDFKANAVRKGWYDELAKDRGCTRASMAARLDRIAAAIIRHLVKHPVAEEERVGA